MRNTRVIAFANNKGGSGKSTTASNVGAALAQSGMRVLAVDGDMQMNLTLAFMDEEQALALAHFWSGSPTDTTLPFGVRC